ncbi:MAG: YdcF family protein [Gemmatimonadaceae bacterium]|nr:YdcF family protein [Gemmatimonadaceae bacterium]MCW5826962.1 YdcF family protein [Gemmatimonadaceae bacterium]
MTAPRWSLRRRWALAVLALGALAWVASALAVLHAAGRDEARAAQAIVVLGAAQYRGRPSPVLRARLDHAVGLYAQGIAPRIVLTGGVAEGDTASEAAVSRLYALQAGVPDSAILLENEGRTTAQSLARVARLLHARRLDTVVVVSDPFHVRRAGLVAQREGLVVYASPTRTDGVWRRVVRQPGYFFGETVKAPLSRVVDW